MAIIRWDPFRDLVTIRDKMNRLFEDAVTQRGEEKELVASSWAPAVDIYEDESQLVLTAEIPGLSEKDVEIKIEDNVLSIQGERKLQKETREENYHRIERAYGSFYRSFTLPNYVDEDKIRAENENGVVKITMPKKAELKPRKVKIVPQTQEEKSK
jgi:HSP20 family protein